MIDIDHASFHYPNGVSDVIRDLTLRIGQGEFVACMGPNGSGKSTFARLLNGLFLPTAGMVSVDGINSAESGTLLELRRRVGLVFQDPNLQIVSPTVERELAFGLQNLGLPSEEIHRRVTDQLSRLGIEGLRYRSPSDLSGGEKQKVAIAAIMIMRPSYLILDEPTSLLSPKARKEILALLAMVRSTMSIGIVIITQFPSEALQAERLVVLHEGRIHRDGIPSEVFRESIRLYELGVQVPFSQRVDR